MRSIRVAENRPSRLTPLAICVATAFAAPFSSGSEPPAMPFGVSATAGSAAHTLPVTSCADDGSPGTLRTVVAEAGSGDTIDLTQLHCGAITLLTGQIEVHVDDLTLNGPGQDVLAVDGNYNGRVFHHDGTGTLTVSGFTVQHGVADSRVGNPSSAEGAWGGCILSNHYADQTSTQGAVALSYATVTGCRATAMPGQGQIFINGARGGGVFAASHVFLDHATISDNVAVSPYGYLTLGGGVYAQSGVGAVPSVITTSTISGNRSESIYNVAAEFQGFNQAQGGGLRLGDGASITDSLISGNFAGCDTATVSCQLASGGGIFALASLSIATSVVAGNVVEAGGLGSVSLIGAGIKHTMPSPYALTITDSTITGNQTLTPNAQICAFCNGGGVSVSGGGDMQVLASTIDNNISVGKGGGFYGAYTPLSFTNSTISGNSAAVGGALFSTGFHGTDYPMVVRNSTVTLNSAANGGGIVDNHAPASGLSDFESSIVAGNINTDAHASYGADLASSQAGATITGANNLIIDAAGVILPPDTISADPTLGPLQDNGGPTFTHALLTGSPAIDVGNDIAGLDFDQRGEGYPRVSGAAADIGAFELQQMLGDQPPVAQNDSYTATENTTLSVSAPGVLGNDSDPDGDTLTAILASGPSNGTLTLNPDGSFVYVPAAEFSGTDRFTYEANDGQLNSNVATVTIKVGHVDQPPVAANDSYTAAENTPLKVSAPGVLGNDSDPDGDTLTAILISSPANGALAMNPDGSFIYVPTTGFSGTDSFTYEANDGQLNSNVATVTIKIGQFDQPPIAANDSYTAAENSTLKVSAPGVLGNDSDPNGDTLTAVLMGTPSNGTLAMNPDGSFIYVPVIGFSGTDRFTYEANDGQLNSNVATVTITITPSSEVTIFSDGFDGP